MLKQTYNWEVVMKYQTPEGLEQLIKYIVSLDSRSGTQGEIQFPHNIKDLLLELDYFKKNDKNIELHDAGDDLSVLTALYDSGKQDAQTLVIMSHYDTVHTNDFGTYEHIARDVDALTKTYKTLNDFPLEVQQDIDSDKYLFGRGVMDMKMGLAQHIRMIEKASVEQLPVNLLLLTVPDEEVDSKGMRTATTVLNKIRKERNLNYALILNSEPSFMQTPNDPNYYIYTGSIGKIMPAALSYGVETHVGEPLKGLNALFMASMLNTHMEYQTDFNEEVYGEQTPLPITLRSDDLKMDYNTQVTHHVASIYNVFTMQRSANEVFSIFNQVVDDAIEDMMEKYSSACRASNIEPTLSIKKMTYEALLNHAYEKLGRTAVEEIIQESIQLKDMRQQSFDIVTKLLQRMKELTPAVVTMFAPPYYPAVNNTDHPLIEQLIELTKTHVDDVKVMHYFNGISDLSYVDYEDDDASFTDYEKNTPVYDKTYHIPFEDMKALNTPFINIGPFGKDPHKYTERLHKKHAFVTTTKLLDDVMTQFYTK